MAHVIGIGIGGTSTDAFVADEAGRVAAATTPSTPPDPSQGFLAVLDELAGSLGTTTTGALLAHTHDIVHGTTSTLNSLVTGDVATVGFLTGQRDARVRETAPRAAGPSVRAEAGHFTDREVVLRQTSCPQCPALLRSEIVPGDEPSHRSRSVEVVGA